MRHRCSSMSDGGRGQKHPGHDPGPEKVPSSLAMADRESTDGQATAYNSRAQPLSSDRGSFLGGKMLVVYISVRPCFPGAQLPSISWTGSDAWSYQTPLRVDDTKQGSHQLDAVLMAHLGLVKRASSKFSTVSTWHASSRQFQRPRR